MNYFVRILFLSILIISVGCDQNSKKKSTNSDNSSVVPTCSIPEITLIGSEKTGTNGTLDVAKIWKIKNSSPTSTSLTNGSESAQGVAFFLSENLIYAVGQESLSNLDYVKLWKYDGSSTTAVTMSSVVTIYGAKSTGLAQVGNDIYASGNQIASGSVNSVVKLWKYSSPNSVTEISLTTSSSSNEVTSMIAVGTDLYLSGFNYNNYPRPRLWKYETSTQSVTEIDLSIGTVSAQANTLAALGNNIYLVGKQHNNTVYVAHLWKYDGTNVTDLNLTTDPTKTSEALGVLSQDSKLYITGYESNGNFKVAKMWSYDESTVTPVNLGDGQKDTVAKTVSVYQNKFYLYGTELNSSTNISKILQWIYDGSSVTQENITDGSHDVSVGSSSLVCQ